MDFQFMRSKLVAICQQAIARGEKETAEALDGIINLLDR